MRRCAQLLLLPWLATTACDSGEATSASSGIDTADSARGSTSSDPSGSTSTSTNDSTSSGSTAGPGPQDDNDDAEDDTMDVVPPVVWDVLQVPDAGELNQGCRAVDFLFVIDNSFSMDVAQANLLANFPAFIDGIQNSLTEVDSYHVGVITSDEYDYNTPECGELGGLVVQTGGLSSSNMMCGPFVEGGNFITEQDDLAASFNCTAQVGIGGAGLELPMTAMQRAIDGSLSMPGGCNEGFLRDDALLVVVVITDEADGPGDSDGSPPLFTSEGTPESWYETVVAAKGGIPENAVALVLANYEGGPCPPAFSYEDGVNLVAFANLFGENGFTAGICEPDYGPSFAEATAVIDAACENFVPPG